MKKKLLFLGFLVGIFAALMILPASAIELPSEDAGCDFCRATWEQMEGEDIHCSSYCYCHFVTCPTCGEKTVLRYCAHTHDYSLSATSEQADGRYLYSVSCKYGDCGFNKIIYSDIRPSDHPKEEITVANTHISAGYTGTKCTLCGDQYCRVFSRTEGKSIYNISQTHSFTFLQTVSPTCQDGYDLYTCSGCSLQKADNFVVGTGHDPVDGSAVVTPPTCLSSGYTTYTCSACSEQYTADETPVAGHRSSSPGIVTPATCTAGGYTTYVCDTCQEEYVSDETTAIGHNYIPVVTAPTCTTAGYTTYTCTVCAYSYTGNNTAATGHKNTIKVNTAATCTTAGSQTTTCSVCGNTTTSEIPATGHSYKSTTVVPNCTQGGYTIYTCSACSDSYQGDQIAATGHKYQDVVTEPTCTKGGYTKHTCSVCQDTYTDAVTSATGHNYKDLVTAPTCTVRGYTDHTCINCGDNYRDTFVAALGHTEERYGLDWKCTVCGRIRVVTTGIRAVGSILDGFQIFGVGFASGAVDLFDGMVMNGEELTTIASAAFALAGLVLIGVVVYAVIRKFTKRR